MLNFLISLMYICVTTAVLIINSRKKITLFSPNSLYTILWSFCGICSIYNNLGLLKPRTSIHIFIILSIIIFNFIYYSFGKNKTKIDIDGIQKHINYKMIIICNLIALICILPNTINAIQIIQNRGLDLTYIRTEVYMNSASIINRTIPKAIVGATSIMAAIDLIISKKKKLIPIALLGIIITTITYGGRYTILNFLIYIVASYFIIGKKINIRLKKKYIIIPILALVLVTSIRNKEVTSIFKSIISYFVGSLSFLEYILQHEVQYGLTEGYKFGYLAFAFLIEPFIYFIKFIFASKIKIPSYYFNIHAQEFVNIGATTIQFYNNNATYFYNFLLDYGKFGFIMAPIILSGIVTFLQNSFYKKQNVMSLELLIYMYSAIINSSMIYSLGSISSSFAIVFLILFYKKNIVEEKKDDKQITLIREGNIG